MKELFYIANDYFFGIETLDEKGIFVSGTDSKQTYNDEPLFKTVEYVEQKEWEERKAKFLASEKEKQDLSFEAYNKKREALKEAFIKLGIDKELLEVL